MKKCCRCQKNKPLLDFTKNRSTKDGLQAECRVCQRDRFKKWMEENPDRYKATIARWKKKKHLKFKKLVIQLKDKPCADCDNKFLPCAMDFDHRPGTKKLFEINGARSRSIKRLLAEIAKCDIICANCHRVRTWKRSCSTVGLTRFDLAT